MGEDDVALCAGLHQFQIDALLRIHVVVVLAALQVIHHFKFQAAFTYAHKMCPVKTRHRYRIDDLAQRFRQFRNLLARGLMDKAEVEQYASLRHAFVIADGRFQQFGIRADQLLAAEAVRSRGLDADIFHGSLQIIDYDKVADFKWLATGAIPTERGESASARRSNRRRESIDTVWNRLICRVQLHRRAAW